MVRNFSYWRLSVFDWWRYSSDGRAMYMFSRITDAQCLVGDVNRQMVGASWNVMAHAQKPDFFFRRNGRINLNRRSRQFSRLLAAEVCASAVVMLGTPCSEVVWRVLATHSIRQFPLHFPSRASPSAITFKLESTKIYILFSPLRDTVCMIGYIYLQIVSKCSTFSPVRDNVWFVTLMFGRCQNVYTFSSVRQTVLWLVTLIFIWYQNVHTFFPVRDTLCVIGDIDLQVVSKCTYFIFCKILPMTNRRQSLSAGLHMYLFSTVTNCPPIFVRQNIFLGTLL